MKRTTILLPSDLRAKAKRLARSRGITFSELVRNAIEGEVATSGRRPSVFNRFPFPKGVKGPRDLASNADEYLYGDKRGSS